MKLGTPGLHKGRRLLLSCLLPVLAAVTATAQEIGAAPDPADGQERPGLFRIGAWYLTPYIDVGTLGVDTNVFYTATDRQADFTASGGPGLEVVRPFGGTHRFRLDGGLNYLWFARTPSQRRLNWYGTSELELQGVKTSLRVTAGYVGSFSRPAYDVDRRVQRDTTTVTARLVRRLADRWQTALWGSFEDVGAEESTYLGADLASTLTKRQYDAGMELRRALTVKSQVATGLEQSWYSFPLVSERDGQSTLAYAGFRTRSDALVSGDALGGYRWFWPEGDLWAQKGLWYASVNAQLNLTERTIFGATFYHDLDYSALATATGAPTLVNEQISAFFEKLLTSRVYFRLFGRQIRYVTEDLLLPGPEGGSAPRPRNDRIREAGVELGYQFRSRVRMGVSAVYTERRSNIETFGIQGLLAGFKVSYNPPTPVVR